MRHRFLLLTLLPAVLLAGCGSSSTSTRVTLRLPVQGRAIVPDPARAASLRDITLDSLLYSGLMKFSPDLHIIPELAVSIPTISQGGRTYTFTIRQDARFADGRHCTAQDVAHSLARALSPALSSSVARHELGNLQGARAVEEGRATVLSGVEVLGRLSLRLHLQHPDATFLDDLALPPAAVVERGVHQSAVAGQPPLPAGLGPWRLSGRARDGSLLLTPRPHFFGDPLTLRTLILHPVPSLAAGLVLYRKHEVDVAPLPPTDDRAYLTNPEFHQNPALIAYYALPSADGAALADHLHHARLSGQVGPQVQPLTGIVPPSVPDYVSASRDIDGTAPAPAVRLAGAAGPTRQALRRALARQWHVTPRGLLVRLVRWSVLVPDPGRWLALAAPLAGTARYRKLLRRADRLTNDPVDRMNEYSEEERRILNRGLVIPLAVGTNAYLIRPQVQGLQVTPLGLMPQNDSWGTVSLS